LLHQLVERILSGETTKLSKFDLFTADVVPKGVLESLDPQIFAEIPLRELEKICVLFFLEFGRNPYSAENKKDCGCALRTRSDRPGLLAEF